MKANRNVGRYPWAGSLGEAWTRMDQSRNRVIEHLTPISLGIKSVMQFGTRVAVQSKDPHGLSPDDFVRLSGAYPKGINGTWIVTEVQNPWVFIYESSLSQEIANVPGDMKMEVVRRGGIRTDLERRFNETLRERSGKFESPNALVGFLYLLMRDHLPLGVVERITRDSIVPKEETCRFTNGYLAEYANDLAERLTEEI